jgi:hypothetical protein
MSWKEWPYWKKGAVIGADMSILVYLLRWILYLSIGDHWFSYMFKLILIVLGLPISPLITAYYLVFGNLLAYFLDIITTIAWWSIMGGLIGLVVGKIRKTKL